MANKNYLDKSGLQFFWSKVKDWIAGKHFLSYDSQGLTTNEKTQARSNIGVVGYEEQTLSNTQQSQARTNIGAGTYTKPSDGIPKTDLAAAVQSSLEKADSALQSVPSATYNTAGVVILSTDIETDAASNNKATTPSAVVHYVSTQIGSAFRYGGSIAFESLPATPSAADANSIYNITNSFTTTSAFIEGAGVTYPAGTNVIVATIESAYKYDVMSGFLDLSPYATSSWVSANFAPVTIVSELVYSSELIAITDSEITTIVV